MVREKLTPRYAWAASAPASPTTTCPPSTATTSLLETSAIEEITPDGVRTADGTEHEVDMLILATGFKVFESGNMPPYPVPGAGGVDLESWWDENRFQAYQGVSVPGFPNFFTILGPYAYNGSSYFKLIENQTKHIVRCLAPGPADRGDVGRGHARGERALLRVDAGPAQEPGLLPGSCWDGQQLLLRPARRRAVPGLAHVRGGLAQRALRPGRLPFAKPEAA